MVITFSIKVWLELSLYKKNISGLVMDYSYILNTSLPQKEKLLDFGFSEVGAILVLKKEIAGGQFYAEIKLFRLKHRRRRS